MPNARSKTQTLLAFTLDARLAKALDTVSLARGENRSQFIRRAIVSYLEELGESVPESLAQAPDRRLMDRYDQLAEAPTPQPVDYRKVKKPARKSAKK